MKLKTFPWKSVFVNDVNQERQQEAAEDSSIQEYA